MKIHVPRVRLSAKEYELLQQLRGKEIESEESHEALKNYCEENQIPFTNVNHYWHKGKNFSLHVKNDLQPTYMEMRDDIISEMKAYAPEYKTISRQSTNTDSHLFVVDPADIHVGKLSKSFEVGAEYNAEIAVNRVNEGVEGLVQKSAGFSIDKILLIIGNDVLHTDITDSNSTSGIL
jgi:glycine/serine hydroxymethyltransferase